MRRESPCDCILDLFNLVHLGTCPDLASSPNSLLPKNMFKLGAHHTGTPPPWPTQLESRWLTFDWIALLYLLCHYNVFVALSRNKDTCTSNVNEVLLSKSPQKRCEMDRKPPFLVVASLHWIPLSRRSVTRSTRGHLEKEHFRFGINVKNVLLQGRPFKTSKNV